MGGQVFFVVELEISAGQAEDLRGVAHEMVELARKNEPGTLSYQYFLSDDGATCHIYERYVDIDALQAHSASFPAELNVRSQAFRPRRLTAYGNVPAAIRAQRIDPISQAVPGLSAVYMEALSGFSR